MPNDLRPMPKECPNPNDQGPFGWRLGFGHWSFFGHCVIGHWSLPPSPFILPPDSPKLSPLTTPLHPLERRLLLTGDPLADYYPLTVGSTWRYGVSEDGGARESLNVSVGSQTRIV